MKNVSLHLDKTPDGSIALVVYIHEGGNVRDLSFTLGPESDPALFDLPVDDLIVQVVIGRADVGNASTSVKGSFYG